MKAFGAFIYIVLLCACMGVCAILLFCGLKALV